MIIIGEAIQRVQSLYSKGLHSDDSRLTSRHIYSALISGRSILLRQRVNSNQRIDSSVYQVLPCVKLIKASPHECGSCVPDGCVVLRSQMKLPKGITGLSSTMLVTSLDGSVSFEETTFENYRYRTGNKYTGNKPAYYRRNGYLYITLRKELKAVSVTDIYEDPIEAHIFPTICDEGSSCNNCVDVMSLEFHIEGDLMKPLVQLANDELLVLFKQMMEDKNNDANDNDSPTGMIHQPTPRND